MTAGDSAREQARRLSEVSGYYENKAKWASVRSANFAAGAAGEEALAEAFAPLTAKDWHPLYDRASPNGGNIDLLAVGPAGVAVIDAKSWSDTVTIDGTRLLLEGHNRAKDLNGVHRQVAEVEAALRDAQPQVTVRGFLALAGEQDRNRPSETVDGIRVLGVDQLVEKFGRSNNAWPPSRLKRHFETSASPSHLLRNQIVAGPRFQGVPIHSRQPTRV
jgi:roadblock/LC7 domain-containing protein